MEFNYLRFSANLYRIMKYWDWKWEGSLSPFPFIIALVDLVHQINREKEIKWMMIKKKKMPLFSVEMIVYTEIQRNLQEND